MSLSTAHAKLISSDHVMSGLISRQLSSKVPGSNTVASDCKLHQFTGFSLPSILDERTRGSTVGEMKDSKRKEGSKTVSALTEG